MSGDFQDEIKCLGIEASPSFVREPEGNGVAERFIRTLKERAGSGKLDRGSLLQNSPSARNFLCFCVAGPPRFRRAPA